MAPVAESVQCHGGMGKGAARPHLGGDPDRFHDLFVACSCPVGELGVTGDAVGALGDVGDRHRDQLLGLRGQGAVSENLLAERVECFVDPGSELTAAGADLGGTQPPCAGPAAG